MNHKQSGNAIDQPAASQKEMTRHRLDFFNRRLRAVLLLVLFFSFFGPWGTEDGTVLSGWRYAMSLIGWTAGFCALPYLSLFITGLLAGFFARFHG
jgi:hypothetical protein